MELRDAILRKARESAVTKEQFFTAQADAIVACCTAMARAFDAGATLYAMGNGGGACDAQHVAVEFAHPIIEKRPALRALALGTDPAYATAIGNDRDFSLVFAQQLRLLAGPGDIAVAISSSGKSASIQRALATARELGMITVGLCGRDGGRMPEACDHCFVVPSFSTHRIQETHETLLHVMWDLIHVIRGEEDVI